MNSEQIRELRERAKQTLGLSRDRFAEAAGVSTSTLQRWEDKNDKAKPSPREEELLKALEELIEKVRDQGPEKVAKAVASMVAAGAVAGLGTTAARLLVGSAPVLAAVLGVTGWGLFAQWLSAKAEEPKRKSK